MALKVALVMIPLLPWIRTGARNIGLKYGGGGGFQGGDDSNFLSTTTRIFFNRALCECPFRENTIGNVQNQIDHSSRSAWSSGSRFKHDSSTLMTLMSLIQFENMF